MTYEPAQWLKNLAQTSPVTHWPWRHSVRLMLITTIPMAIGFHTGHVAEAMLVCLGGLLTSIKVQTDPYRIRFRRILISAPIGMSGYVLGSLIGGHGPWTIAGVVLVAVISGLISSYGAAVSAAALQMLVMTVVAAHVHSDGPIWLMPALFLSGACYAAALLALEALFTPNNPERKIISGLVNQLADVASLSVREGQDSEAFKAAFRKLTNAQNKAYEALLSNQRQADGRSIGGDHDAKILAIIDRVCTLLNEAPRDTAQREQAGELLRKLALALRHPAEAELPDIRQNYDDPLLYNVIRLQHEIAALLHARPGRLLSTGAGKARPGRIHVARLKDKLFFGRETIFSSLKLALCMLVAMIAEYTFPGERTYWIPLSVAVILKPDFGSVFVRAVLRSVGTLAGVILATAIFMVVPKGMPLVAVIAVLSALLPWASLKSYAFMCTFLTPLILVLIDLIIPGPTVNYAEPRLVDTLIGAFIVLVFGQLLWPNSSLRNLQQNFAAILQTLADYLDEIRQRAEEAPGKPAAVFDETAATRRSAYARLSDFRVNLQRLAAEPPPSSTRALAWLPAISSCERICDYMSNYAMETKAVPDEEETAAISVIATTLRQLAGAATSPAHVMPDPPGIKTTNPDLMNIFQNVLNVRETYFRPLPPAAGLRQGEGASLNTFRERQ